MSDDADIGGIPELLVEGETGYVFEACNVQSLTDALRCVQAMPGERLRSMGEAARRHVETNFTRERYRDEMLVLYASLGAGSSSPEAASHGRAD